MRLPAHSAAVHPVQLPHPGRDLRPEVDAPARGIDVRRTRVLRVHSVVGLQHHAQVAALSEDEQERWLARAEEEGWPQSRLRKEIQASRVRTPDSEPITVTVTVQITFEREQRWKAAAEVASAPLPEWIAQTLDHAAGRVDDEW
ncbi:hypothetical protein [Nonomuraea sp. LPB2021202275-12-8]|uniref:hypothetical protein n=1 Tax=Nonomuraea sp. LPB2021202275-12-8 TaxID=3120159 RepID=UPI00300D43D6